MSFFSKKNFYRFLRRVVLWGSDMSVRFNPKYHLTRLLRGFAVVEVNGSKMYLDLKNDVGISKDLFIFRKREFVSTDYLIDGKVLNAGDVVLDIGANIGYYALLEARLVGPTGRVYAMEPVSSNYNLLKKNIELNDLHNIQTFRIAAGDENKESEIYVATKGNISSFIYKPEAVFVAKEKVHVTTVDDFVAEHRIDPRLVRMDVEGYEKEIIQGMQKTLLRHPLLFIEVHPHLMSQEELAQMFRTIEESGYKKAVVIKEKKEVWMKRNGEIRPLLRFLSNKIEGHSAIGMGQTEHMTLSELRRTLPGRGSAFHAWLS